MVDRNREFRRWLWLTIPLAVLLAAAAGSGVFARGLYRDAPSLAAQARGQDIVSLAVVLPVLVLSAVLAARGSPRARLAWMGALVYLVYTYLIAAFDIAFNALFLVYVGLLGCSLYGLIGSAASVDRAGLPAQFAARTPARSVSIYLAALAALFCLLWLSETAPAVAGGRIPQSVRDNGTPTNGVHVLDLAWVLPALVFAAVNLWRKRPLGYLLAGILLAYIPLLALAILSMAVSMARAGLPVSIPQVSVFALLFLTSAGFLAWYLAGCRPPPRPDAAGRPDQKQVSLA